MSTQRIKDRVARSIGGSQAEVFLRSDFEKIGGYAQVGKALNALQREGRLVRLGYGVYSKARPSSLSGQPVPRKPLEILARETLEKLDVPVRPGRAAREYAQGSTQVPVAVALDVGNSRVSRRLRVGGREVQYERDL